VDLYLVFAGVGASRRRVGLVLEEMTEGRMGTFSGRGNSRGDEKVRSEIDLRNDPKLAIRINKSQRQRRGGRAQSARCKKMPDLIGKGSLLEDRCFGRNGTG